MNNQEREALQDFLQELVQARAAQKDSEAESLIHQAMAQQSDAPYLLVQRNLLQEQALNAAKCEIEALRSQIDQLRLSGNTGFLDSASDWGNSSRRYSPVTPAQNCAANPSYDDPPGSNNFPRSRPGLLGGGMGSFLGSMAATAAGVAAGSFLFNGIGGLLHEHKDSANPDMAGRNEENPNQFMNADRTDYGGLAEDAGIDDIGSADDFGGTDDVA